MLFPMGKKQRIAVTPDIHFPFADYKALAQYYQFIADFKPDMIINVGDVLDLYSQARFARSQDVMTPKEELEEGIAAYKGHWAKLMKLTNNNARYVQLGGNHTSRHVRMAIEKAPELLPFLNVDGMFKIKGVEVRMDSREEFVHNGIVFCHGWLSRLGDHAKYFNMPVVRGHSHKAGIWYENQKTSHLWEMECGFLGDEFQVPLLYRATKTCKWSKGWAAIDEFGPRIILAKK